MRFVPPAVGLRTAFFGIPLRALPGRLPDTKIALPRRHRGGGGVGDVSSTAGLERDRADVLWPVLHPVGDVTSRLRETCAVEGVDPHDGLDRGDELLLEVGEVVECC